MNDDEYDISAEPAEEDPAAGCPIGEIDLGRAPALGRRARVLAGLTSATAAAILVTGIIDTGTVTHTGPFPPL